MQILGKIWYEIVKLKEALESLEVMLRAVWVQLRNLNEKLDAQQGKNLDAKNQ